MKQPIFSNQLHKASVEDYMTLLTNIVEDLSTESQFNEYLDLVDSIIDYHNGYDGDVYSWLMIMPLHLSVMTSGLFVGLENDENRGAIRGYKVILDNHLHALAEILSTIKLEDNE